VELIPFFEKEGLLLLFQGIKKKESRIAIQSMERKGKIRKKVNPLKREMGIACMQYLRKERRGKNSLTKGKFVKRGIIKKDGSTRGKTIMFPPSA